MCERIFVLFEVKFEFEFFKLFEKGGFEKFYKLLM